MEDRAKAIPRALRDSWLRYVPFRGISHLIKGCDELYDSIPKC